MTICTLAPCFAPARPRIPFVPVRSIVPQVSWYDERAIAVRAACRLRPAVDNERYSTAACEATLGTRRRRLRIVGRGLAVTGHTAGKNEGGQRNSTMMTVTNILVGSLLCLLFFVASETTSAGSHTSRPEWLVVNRVGALSPSGPSVARFHFLFDVGSLCITHLGYRHCAQSSHRPQRVPSTFRRVAAITTSDKRRSRWVTPGDEPSLQPSDQSRPHTQRRFTFRVVESSVHASGGG